LRPGKNKAFKTDTRDSLLFRRSPSPAPEKEYMNGREIISVHILFKKIMSKNILLISASPRQQGNSDILCDEFLRGATDAGHQGEKIRLADRDINYCTGCCSCIGGSGVCVQQDDMAEIHKKLLAADVLVLAAPVYFRSFNGHMKTFIDRVCPIYSMIRNKDVYFIISAAGGKLPVDSTVESFRVFTDCLSGIREKGIISSTGIWDEGGVRDTSVMQQAYTAGRNA
jgi:multimeric flavodoxin WrbA